MKSVFARIVPLCVVLLLVACLMSSSLSAAGALPSPARAPADSWNVELVGRLDGHVYAVAVQGNYAYIVVENSLVVVDISDKAHPVVVGQISEFLHPIWGLHDVAVAGGYAYLAATYSGLRVIDISTPSTPIEVGFYTAPGLVHGVAVAGNYAYVAADEAGLRVVDISTPSNPVEVGFYDSPWYATRVAVAGNYAYLADIVGMRVVDISRPSCPIEVGAYATPYTGGGTLPVVMDVAVLGNYAYIAEGAYGLRVVDVSLPSQPTGIGIYDTPLDARGVAVQGRYAYIAGDAGLRLIDVSAPSDPREVGFYVSRAQSWDVAVAGDYIYVAAGDGLLILRITESDPVYTIYGYVRSSGWPVSGVSISDGAGHTATTGDDGRYMIPDLPAGVYTLTPSKSGCIFSPSSLTITVPESTAWLNFEADCTFHVSGHVRDGSGAPVAGVTISDGADHTTTTESDGTYALNYLPGGTYTLTPSKSGCIFTPSSRTVSGPPDVVDQDFTARCAFDVSGRVTDGSGNPFAGVCISDGLIFSAMTDANGRYTVPQLVPGTYTLIPALAGYAFQPAARTVRVPPDAAGQDFTILPAPVSITLGLSGTLTLPDCLVYTDTQALTTTVCFARGALHQVTTVVLTPTLAQGGAGLAFAGHAFDLHPTLALSAPATVTIRYSAQDVRLVSDEGQLSLRWWAGDGWIEAASTCTPPSTYTRDADARVIGVPVCHLGRFALLGPTQQLFLPLVLRGS